MMNKEELETSSFEGLMNELKKTLEKLEKGELPLEESMSAYEYGVGLVRRAQEKLASMEGRMEEILQDGSRRPVDENKLMSDVNDKSL